MIKEQTTTQERPVFGVTPQKAKEATCNFQVMMIDGSHVKSSACQDKALANGWCKKHQHAQAGMDIGERLGYRCIEIREAYTIIGQGRANWEAYFERAEGEGLKTVMDYLSKLC